jgi:hypothetical protein
MDRANSVLVTQKDFEQGRNGRKRKKLKFWLYHLTRYIYKSSVPKDQDVWARTWLANWNSWLEEPQLQEDRKI